MIFCFLTSVDYGFRTRGGIGELITRISFERNKGRYMGRLFYDIIYFILVIVLMLELVFGIIVETFRDLRIEETHHDYDKANICFICGIKKDDLEKNRQNFQEHCEKVHNIWNYINYILRLKFSDPQDLNAINSFALENIEMKRISWVPLIEKNQSPDLGNHEEESTEEESEINGSVNEEERVLPKINH